jgi:2-dehydro-3-deoxy-D-pentonate aldolase
MKYKKTRLYQGVVVPMVTPVTATGGLDEAAARRIIHFLLTAGVQGVFVLGTTGEAASVSAADKLRLVKLAAEHIDGRAKLYAGVNENSLRDAIHAGNTYLGAGVDVVVSLLPSFFPLRAREISAYFSSLLNHLEGPVILYNIPATTRMSIPIETLESLVGHPRFLGVKDSENNPSRLETIIEKFRERDNFSVFIGVGALMNAANLRRADGMVPSMANLSPGLCVELFGCAQTGNRSMAEELHKKMMKTAALYQRGRTLGQSLAALKAAMSFLGLCEPAMLSPLLPLDREEIDTLYQDLVNFGLSPSRASREPAEAGTALLET